MYLILGGTSPNIQISSGTPLEYDMLNSFKIVRFLHHSVKATLNVFHRSFQLPTLFLFLEETKILFFFYFQYLNQEQLFWVDRSGVQHTLATLGNNSCDARIPTMMTDIGEINDMTKLPASKIFYGPLHESAKMIIYVGPLECVPKDEDQRYSLKRHVMNLESRIDENNVTISNVEEEHREKLQDLADQKTTIDHLITQNEEQQNSLNSQKTEIDQINTDNGKQQNLVDEHKTKIDQLLSDSEQHQDELQRLSVENVAEVKELAEQKSLLDEHKSELDRFTSESEQWQEGIETRLGDFNSTISQLGCPNEGNYRTINGGCYLYIINEEKNYNDAKSLCGERKIDGRTGQLVEPKTTSINKLIHDEAKIVFGSAYPYYWIGINDINNEGNWVSTSTGIPATSNFLCEGQPNGHTGENCARTCGCAEAEWCDAICGSTYRVICEF